MAVIQWPFQPNGYQLRRVMLLLDFSLWTQSPPPTAPKSLAGRVRAPHFFMTFKTISCLLCFLLVSTLFQGGIASSQLKEVTVSLTVKDLSLSSRALQFCLPFETTVLGTTTTKFTGHSRKYPYRLTIIASCGYILFRQ